MVPVPTPPPPAEACPGRPPREGRCGREAARTSTSTSRVRVQRDAVLTNGDGVVSGRPITSTPSVVSPRLTVISISDEAGFDLEARRECPGRTRRSFSGLGAPAVPTTSIRLVFAVVAAPQAAGVTPNQICAGGDAQRAPCLPRPRRHHPRRGVVRAAAGRRRRRWQAVEDRRIVVSTGSGSASSARVVVGGVDPGPAVDARVRLVVLGVDDVVAAARGEAVDAGPTRDLVVWPPPELISRSPAPPSMTSAPSWPSIRSLPAPPRSTSGSELPRRSDSLPGPPSIVSGPEEVQTRAALAPAVDVVVSLERVDLDRERPWCEGRRPRRRRR